MKIPFPGRKTLGQFLTMPEIVEKIQGKVEKIEEKLPLFETREEIEKGRDKFRQELDDKLQLIINILNGRGRD